MCLETAAVSGSEEVLVNWAEIKKSEKICFAQQLIYCVHLQISANQIILIFSPKKPHIILMNFSHEFILCENDLIIPLTEQVVGLFGNTAFVPKTEEFQFCS